LIRPRRGNFTYSYEEIKTVEEQIEWAQSMGVQGVVIGALNEDRSLPLPVLKKWVATAKSMDLTFHRAFDRVIHAEESLKKIIDLGFNRVLTSGQQQTALQGIGLLNKLNQIAQGKLVVMPGGGINDQNCDLFFKEGFDEIHLSGKGKEKTALKEPIADLNTIRKVVACAQKYQ
jgi:copper homeostasis protein